MRKILLIASFISILMSVSAQNSMFEEGDKNLKLGVGIRWLHTNIIGSVDYCIADDVLDEGSFGVGPYANVEFGTNELKIGAGARGTFHYPFIDDLDTYLGFGLGLRYDMFTYSPNKLNIVPGFFVGANYSLNESLKVFGEVGSGVSFLSVGLVFAF